MKNFDVVIVGAGLAGLQCAKLLAGSGAKVLLVDRKTDLSTGVHTTGIFVRKTLEDFDLPADCLGKAVRRVSLYSPRLRVLNFESRFDEFRVGRMGELYERFLEDAVQSGAEFSPATKYCGIETGDGETIVKLERNNRALSVKTKLLIGADGARSRVARDLDLDENREWIVGCEDVYKSASAGEPRLHCFLDADLAPGYLAWAADDGEEIHVGVGGYAERFNPREALKIFKGKIDGEILDLSRAELKETRGGRIPVGGVLRRIGNERGLLVGDAAGAVSPLTAGGLDPCLRLSVFAARTVAEFLKTGDAAVLRSYSGDLFRPRFVSRLWMRRILANLNHQWLLETGCAVLRLPGFDKLAAHVFFGRGSFPDVETSFTGENESLRASLAEK